MNSAQPNLNTTLGAFEIACILSVLLFGILCAQLYTYFWTLEREAGRKIDCAVRYPVPLSYAAALTPDFLSGVPGMASSRMANSSMRTYILAGVSIWARPSASPMARTLQQSPTMVCQIKWISS